MSPSAAFDAGPLSWVKREIDGAMARGLEALATFAAAGAAEPGPLKTAQAHLHQAHGALQIVGLDGVTRISAELEALLGDMERDPARRTAAHLSAAERAFHGIVSYLDALMSGTPHQPLRLLPVYSALLEARGAAAADPVDLYFPNLSHRPPPRERSLPSLHPDELRQHLRNQRARYLRGLLAFLKNDHSGIEEMRAAVAAIESVHSLIAERAFWWVALAVFEALQHGALPADAEAKRLCNRVEQQIHRLMEGSPNVAERLMRETLYFVARAAPASEHIRMVQETCRLAGTLPAQAEPAEDPRRVRARDALAHAKDAWDRFSAGHAASLKDFCEGARAFQRSALDLARQDFAKLATGINDVGDWLAQDGARMNEALALETATALLLAQSALAELESLGAEFTRQSRLLCERLAGCLDGTLLRTAMDSPVLDEMSRRAQERLVVEQTLADMRSRLRAIEGVLDGYFREPARRERLAEAAAPLEQLDHALQLLGEKRAREALGRCAQQIRRFASPDNVPDAREFETLAQTLAGLGFYFDALSRGGADFDQAMRPVAAASAEQPPEPVAKPLPAGPQEPGVPSVDAELVAVYLEESQEVLAQVHEHLDTLRVNSVHHEALASIRRGFHTLKGSARMVGLKRLGEAAWAVEQTLNLWLQEGRAADPGLLEFIATAGAFFNTAVLAMRSGGTAADEASLVALAAAVRRGEAPAPAPERSAAAEEGAAAAAGLDDSVALGHQRISKTLFTIFSGEARLHLGTLKEEHETLKAHGVISDAMLHAVHTLTGMCGTVQLQGLHELAGAFERALSTLALGPLSDDEAALVAEAVGAIEESIEQALELVEPVRADALIARLREVAALATQSPALAPPSVPELPEEEAALPAPAAVEAWPEGGPRGAKDELDLQLLPVFLDEANELSPAIAAMLRQWREQPESSAHGPSLRRLLHTLKGSARMAGAMALGELAHQMESRIERALALKGPDETLLEELEAAMDRMGVLLQQLRSAAEWPAPASALPAAVSALPPGTPAETVGHAQRASAAQAGEPDRPLTLRVRAELIERLVNQAGEVSIARSRIEGETRGLRSAMRELADNVARLRSQLREIEIHAESGVQSRMEHAQAVAEDFDPLEFDRFTRMQELTRMMAESVNDVQTVQRALLQAMDESDSALAFQARLSRELLQDLMRLRMVPFAELAERLHRVVRQTARDLAKQASLDIRGGHVEVDRSVLERITAPLEHMLRNAVMHGIESPAQRAAAGKPLPGEVRLEVSQEANELVLLLADDGAGLDMKRIRARSLALRLIEPDARCSEAEIADFIFLPGFSTADQVTAIAGRGVGMDVVRTEIAALGGRVRTAFERGGGTRFSCYVPLTLAVSRAVLVKCSGRTWAIPTVMVEQVMHVRAGPLAQAREARHAEWQGRRYAFHSLCLLLGLAESRTGEKSARPVLFLRSGSNSIAIEVDGITHSSQEIVLKPIGPQLARVPGIIGATVLGSAEIVLILNPVQLGLTQAAAPLRGTAPTPEEPAEPWQPEIMVVDDSLTVRKVTGRLLERNGYRVVTARDGVEAMERLQQQLPQAMLVDIEMPRMDGFELMRRVRSDPRLAGVPVVMITSRAAQKHEQHARDIGVDVYLGKPYQEDELLGHLARFVASGRRGG